jgi:quercetin dioxygenase-like cupin family protein
MRSRRLRKGAVPHIGNAYRRQTHKVFQNDASRCRLIGMQAREQKSTAYPAGRRKPVNVMGEIIMCKVTSGETNGVCSMIEEVTPPQGGPPLHIHEREDEILYILEGEYEVQRGGNSFKAATGSWVVLPRNVPHRFRNRGDTSSRLLATMTPGGFECFFEEISELSAGERLDMEEIAALSRKYRVQFFMPSSGKQQRQRLTQSDAKSSAMRAAIA